MSTASKVPCPSLDGLSEDERQDRLREWQAARVENLRQWQRARAEAERRQREDRDKASADVETQRHVERLAQLPSYLSRAFGLPVLPLMLMSDGVRETQALVYARRCVAELDTPGAERVAPMLLLAGETDSGKTTAAVVAVAERCRAALQASTGASYADMPAVEFWSATTMARMGLYRRRNEDGSWGEDPASVIERATECDVLVIDDLGAEAHAGNGPWQATLDEVIDARYRDARVTILTANLTWKAFSERYGARIADRVTHKGRRVIAQKLHLRQPPPKSET